MTEWQTNYNRRVNAERLAAQHPDVKRTAAEILEELKSIQTYLYWALDPDEKDPSYFCSTLIEHAHALIDLGHAYRATIAANPPPEEDGEEDDAPPIDPTTGRPANYRKTDGTWVTIAEGD